MPYSPRLRSFRFAEPDGDVCSSGYTLQDAFTFYVRDTFRLDLVKRATVNERTATYRVEGHNGSVVSGRVTEVK